MKKLNNLKSEAMENIPKKIYLQIEEYAEQQVKKHEKKVVDNSVMNMYLTIALLTLLIILSASLKIFLMFD